MGVAVDKKGPSHPQIRKSRLLCLHQRLCRVCPSCCRCKRKLEQDEMTTIPSRLAQVSHFSSSPEEARRRVIDLYRGWVRAVSRL